MRICIFEDHGVHSLEPLTLTRPAFALRCGVETLLERQRRAWGATEVGVWVRPALAELCRLQYPDLPVNDEAWLRERPVVLVNARWLPGAMPEVAMAPQVGLARGQVAFAATTDGDLPPAGSVPFDAWLARERERLPARDAGGELLDFLWEVVDHNAETLCHDRARFHAQHGGRPAPDQVAVLGPAEQLVLAEDAVVEPFVTVDTRRGPVLIDRGAMVHSFSRIEGPCYIGQGTWVLGAKLRGGCTLGPHCRVGGEVEASVLLGYSNKYHDGFLGHSYLGEWVNLAAGTQTSDLRNDYEKVRVAVAGQRRGTGRTKVGSFIGDHTKTGLGALLNTGSSVGAFCQVLPSGALQPPFIPSFCQVNHGQLQELLDLRKLFGTAALVMQRRGVEMTEAHRELYYTLYEQTTTLRRSTLRDSEIRRLRRSV